VWKDVAPANLQELVALPVPVCDGDAMAFKRCLLFVQSTSSVVQALEFGFASNH
jgi:hypothetical protein